MKIKVVLIIVVVLLLVTNGVTGYFYYNKLSEPPKGLTDAQRNEYLMIAQDYENKATEARAEASKSWSYVQAAPVLLRTN
jgi:uncharacterized protein YxeA